MIGEENEPDRQEPDIDIGDNKHEEEEGETVHPIGEPLSYAAEEGEDNPPDIEKKSYGRQHKDSGYLTPYQRPRPKNKQY